jgi:hypothetical protein
MGTVRQTDRHKLFANTVAGTQNINMYHNHCLGCTKFNIEEGAILANLESRKQKKTE